MLRLSTQQPWAIGIIDGYFHSRMAVMHKEILFAMNKGIRVYGAASMGALRAAELDNYGMIGVGDIYNSYRSGGRLEDDAVAVRHGPDEVGYLPLSIALVDVEATARSLLARRRIEKPRYDAILAATQQLYYPERTWDRIAGAVTRNKAEAQKLSNIMRHGHVERKRLDALELLARIADDLRQPPAPPKPTPPPRTTMFRRAIERVTIGDADDH